MSTINQQPLADPLSLSDLIAVWASANGDTRRASITALLALIQANIVFPSLNPAGQVTFLPFVGGGNNIIASPAAGVDLPAAAVFGQTIEFIATGTNTGAVDITVGTQPNVQMYYRNLPLTGGEIVAGGSVFAIFDGTRYQLLASATVPTQTNSRIVNGKIVRTVNAGALTLALKTLTDTDPSASSPVFVTFPSLVAGVPDGGSVQRTITGPLSLTLPSGATLGHINAVASPVYDYLGDANGTVVLGASNKFFGDGSVQSSTAVSGASTSAVTMYSTAPQANIAWASLDRWKSTQAAAGTWATLTGEVQLYPFPYKRPTTQVFTGSGSYTKPWDLLYALVDPCLGGGGGGGGVAVGANTAASSGAAAGWCKKLLDASIILPTEVVTVGGAGAGAAAGNNPGAAGTASSFGAHCSATGGAAGLGAAAGNVAVPGAAGGGVGTNGDVNATGERGQMSSRAEGYGAIGASTPWGGGGPGGVGTADGGAASGFGAGGGGGIDNGTAVRGGGSASAGLVAVEEHYNEGA